MDSADLSVTQATSLIRAGELSSAEYTQQLLERIDERTDLNAFITTNPEEVLSDAHEADRSRARGEPLGALHGVPLAVKDNIDTANLPTTGGTPALRSHQPSSDAEVVSLLRMAGALVLGKTNLHELAYGLTSENGAFGSVVNPYRADRIAGGSSGGTAAAVSARLSPAGLGTDTGGSVRVPASLCGVVGLRPTVERYSQQGVMVLSRTRDTVGPIARTVADIQLLDAVLSGAGRAYAPDLDTDAGVFTGLRIGVVRHPFTDGVASDVAALFEQRLATLAHQGVHLVELELPDDTDDLIVRAGFPIAFHETTVDLPRYLEVSGLNLTLSDLVARCGSTDVKQLLGKLLGDEAVPLADYRAAIDLHRPALQARMRGVFDAHRLSALVWPTTPLTAAPRGTDEVVLGDRTISAFLAYTRTTNLGSIIGWPGITVPAGLDDAGLPVGLGLDGLPGTDRLLLRIARACERVFGPLPPPPNS